jgi:hypothetical protein
MDGAVAVASNRVQFSQLNGSRLRLSSSSMRVLWNGRGVDLVGRVHSMHRRRSYSGRSWTLRGSETMSLKGRIVSSLTPTRLADGLGPKSVLRKMRCAPGTWVPRSVRIRRDLGIVLHPKRSQVYFVIISGRCCICLGNDTSRRFIGNELCSSRSGPSHRPTGNFGRWSQASMLHRRL